AKWQNVFGAMTRHSVLKQTRRPLGKDDLLVRRYVVAMRVRNESEGLCVPRVQPQILFRQVDTAFVTHFDHLTRSLLSDSRAFPRTYKTYQIQPPAGCPTSALPSPLRSPPRAPPS